MHYQRFRLTYPSKLDVSHNFNALHQGTLYLKFHPDGLFFLSFETSVKNPSILPGDLPRSRHHRTGMIRIMPVSIHRIGVVIGGRRKMKITQMI